MAHWEQRHPLFPVAKVSFAETIGREWMDDTWPCLNTQGACISSSPHSSPTAKRKSEHFSGAVEEHHCVGSPTRGQGQWLVWSEHPCSRLCVLEISTSVWSVTVSIQGTTILTYTLTVSKGFSGVQSYIDLGLTLVILPRVECCGEVVRKPHIISSTWLWL